MLVTFCIILSPLRIGGTALLAASGFGSIVIPVILLTKAGIYSVDLISFTFLCCSLPLLIKHRSDRLRDENFILTLKSRKAQDDLLSSNRQLESLSQIDPLTGLLNRRGFDQHFKAAFDAAQISGEPFAILMLDIDHFKAFNDDYGHQLGDRCLAEVGSLLGDEVGRHGGISARYGGEEFIAALRGIASVNGIAIAQAIRRRISDLRITNGGSDTALITASVGVRIASARKTTRDKFVQEADQALYAAKHAGRNQVALYSRDAHGSLDETVTQTSQDEAPVRAKG